MNPGQSVASRRWRSALASAGALLAGASVALAAYASHGVDGAARAQLQLAAVLAFGHGVALASLSHRVAGRIGVASMASLLAGTLLFSGSLAAHATWGTATAPAPAGGLLLIGGWLLAAIAAWRG